MAPAAPARKTLSDPSERHAEQAVHALLSISGAIISLAGAVLAIGGYLSPINGSAFHMLLGLGLIVSGSLIARRHRAGAWTYMAVFGGTVIWSLGDVHHARTPLALLLVGPSILLAILVVLMPLLSRWSSRQTAVVFAALMIATISLGLSSRPHGRLASSTAAAAQFLDTGTKDTVQ